MDSVKKRRVRIRWTVAFDVVMRPALLLLTLCVRAPGADELLERTKRAMDERLANTPNYTCVLEIDRAVYPHGRSGHYASKEVARVEIAVVGGREFFGWPGEASTETALDSLLGPGLTSTGEFSVHGRATFLDGRSAIERLPDSRQSDAGLVSYSYRVPLAASRYVVATEADKGVLVPYEGEFWVDAEAAQVVKLSLRIPRPPAQSGFRSITSEVSYLLQAVGGKSAWLPSEARVEAETFSGAALLNDLRFTLCRAYQAESTIRFEEAPVEAAESQNGAQPVLVPSGLELVLDLITPLDSVDTRAGDRFAARLARKVQRQGETLLPKGAVVGGRVRQFIFLDATSRVARSGGPQRVTSITLELLDIRWEDRCGRLSGTLDLMQRIPLMARVDPAGGAELPNYVFSSNRAKTYQTMRRMSPDGFGTFTIHGEMFLVREGARMLWRTGEPATGGCAGRR